MPQLNQFLRVAVMAGVESAVQLHIDRGDDLNARDSNGLTLLMLSAAKNRSAICRLLLNAGADRSLLDPEGRTAHTIAIAAGAQQAAEVLEPRISITEPPSMPVPEHIPTLDTSLVSQMKRADEAGPFVDASLAREDTLAPSDTPVLHLNEECDEGSSDLLGWEPEEEFAPPERDPTLEAKASAVQAAISAHEPIDSSTDWDDVDVFLPENSVPFLRKDDLEVRGTLRLLLLRAYREGSVPSTAIESLSLNEDGTANPEFEALLNLVVNDLGAEVDERFEYRAPREDFTVFTSSQESEDEEEVIDNALNFIDSAASRRSDPLRIYLREFQKIKLISGDEEVALAQLMEEQHRRALHALASWPNGIEGVLAAGRLIQARKRALFSVSKGPLDAQLEFGSGEDPLDVADVETDSEASEECAEDSANTAENTGNPFFDSLLRLSDMATASQSTNSKDAIHEQLESLRLCTGFLFELAQTACDDVHESACEFAAAMKEYLRAREQMIAANLKLAFHIAKKYLYSGEPLDDLAQEANIGLMKAVERFDWRRGYKFSTYATWWIRQQITRSIADTVRTIRIPVHVHEKLQRLSKERRIFESENGRQPAPEEIVERLGITLRNLRTLERIPPEPIPIDEKFNNELIDASTHDQLVWPDPFESYAESEFCRKVDSVISSLKLKEEKVTRLRFGIGVYSSFTLEEVGVAYGVTRERIRQIEAKALSKLRHPNRSDQLSLFFFEQVPVKSKVKISSVASVDKAEEIIDSIIDNVSTDSELGAASEAALSNQ